MRRKSGAKSGSPTLKEPSVDLAALQPNPQEEKDEEIFFMDSAKYNSHFKTPQPPEPFPWELSIEERRKASKDPRITKQVSDAAQWIGTPVAGIWERISKIATPSKDWSMDAAGMTELLNMEGITSQHLVAKLLELFDVEKTGVYRGLVLCKIFLLAITGEHQEAIIRHCFDKFDRQPGQKNISLRLLENCQLQDTSELVGSGKGGKKKQKKGSSLPSKMIAGATFHMVEGLKAIVATTELVIPGEITFTEFRQMFLDPDNTTWVGSFLPCFFECAAALFSPPNGRLPIVPLRWLNTIAPVEQPDELYDADVILLREIEALGFDPYAPKKEKKGKARASPKGKKK